MKSTWKSLFLTVRSRIGNSLFSVTTCDPKVKKDQCNWNRDGREVLETFVENCEYLLDVEFFHFHLDDKKLDEKIDDMYATISSVVKNVTIMKTGAVCSYEEDDPTDNTLELCELLHKCEEMYNANLELACFNGSLNDNPYHIFACM